MKLALVSDIHANAEALRATLRAIERESVDRIVCLGDIVGYNTAPDDCAALLREAGALCIAGNHDRAVLGAITTEGFNPHAARAVAWTRARLRPDLRDFLAGLPLKAAIGDQLVIVHGALHPDVGCEVVRLDNDERRRLTFDALVADPSGARVCAYGHTHRAGVHELRDGQVRRLDQDEVTLRDDAHYLINPGTVGAPLTDDRRATFMLFDTVERRVSIRRVEYDAAVPMRKTRKAGLAPLVSLIPRPAFVALKQGLRAVGLLDTARDVLYRLEIRKRPRRARP